MAALLLFLQIIICFGISDSPPSIVRYLDIILSDDGCYRVFILTKEHKTGTQGHISSGRDKQYKIFAFCIWDLSSVSTCHVCSSLCRWESKDKYDRYLSCVIIQYQERCMWLLIKTHSLHLISLQNLSCCNFGHSLHLLDQCLNMLSVFIKANWLFYMSSEPQ